MQEENLMDEFDEDFEYVNKNDNIDDTEFDNIVEKIQDIVLESNFENLQKDFLNQNCMEFDHEEENKIEYMQLFKQYQKQLDAYIQTVQFKIKKELSQRIQGFKMERFQTLLSTRTERIDPQILDMLYSMSDFESFKSLMLDHKTSVMSMSKKKQVKTKQSDDNNNPFKMQIDNNKPKQLDKKKKVIENDNLQNGGFQIICTPLITKKKN